MVREGIPLKLLALRSVFRTWAYWANKGAPKQPYMVFIDIMATIIGHPSFAEDILVNKWRPKV